MTRLQREEAQDRRLNIENESSIRRPQIGKGPKQIHDRVGQG